MATTQNVRTRRNNFGVETPVVTDLIIQTLEASKKATVGAKGLTASEIVDRVQNRAMKFGALPSRRTITSRLSSLYYKQDSDGRFILDDGAASGAGKNEARTYVLAGTPPTVSSSNS